MPIHKVMRSPLIFLPRSFTKRISFHHLPHGSARLSFRPPPPPPTRPRPVSIHINTIIHVHLPTSFSLTYATQLVKRIYQELLDYLITHSFFSKSYGLLHGASSNLSTYFGLSDRMHLLTPFFHFPKLLILPHTLHSSLPHPPPPPCHALSMDPIYSIIRIYQKLFSIRFSSLI